MVPDVTEWHLECLRNSESINCDYSTVDRSSTRDVCQKKNWMVQFKITILVATVGRNDTVSRKWAHQRLPHKGRDNTATCSVSIYLQPEPRLQGCPVSPGKDLNIGSNVAGKDIDKVKTRSTTRHSHRPEVLNRAWTRACGPLLSRLLDPFSHCTQSCGGWNAATLGSD